MMVAEKSVLARPEGWYCGSWTAAETNWKGSSVRVRLACAWSPEESWMRAAPARSRCVGIKDACVSCAACAVWIGGRIVFQGWFGINHVLAIGEPGKAIGSFAVGFGDGGGGPDGAAILNGALEQVDGDSLRRVAGGELDEAVNGRGGLEREDQIGQSARRPGRCARGRLYLRRRRMRRCEGDRDSRAW